MHVCGVDGEISVSSIISKVPSQPGDSLAAGRTTPRAARRPRPSPQTSSSPAIGAPAVVADEEVNRAISDIENEVLDLQRTNSHGKPNTRMLLHRDKTPHTRNLPWEQQPAHTEKIVVPRSVKTRSVPIS